jgi:uncharacterized membrane protein
MWVTAIATIIALLILIRLAARRRMNWARLLFGVACVVGLVTLLQLPEALSANPTAAALSIAGSVLQLVALVLVFLPSARPWFVKPAGSAEPA